MAANAPLGGSPHAPIGRVAHVPAAGAGRIHQEVVLQALPLEQMHKHPLGGRRAADVAQAHEQHPGGRQRGVDGVALTRKLVEKVSRVFESTPVITLLEIGTIGREFEATLKAARFVDKRG